MKLTNDKSQFVFPFSLKVFELKYAITTTKGNFWTGGCREKSKIILLNSQFFELVEELKTYGELQYLGKNSLPNSENDYETLEFNFLPNSNPNFQIEFTLDSILDESLSRTQESLKNINSCLETAIRNNIAVKGFL